MKSTAFKNIIWDSLQTITECMDKTLRPIVEEYGLTIMQARILVEINQCGHHTVGSLASAIGLANGNASSMCKKLEKSGFLKRIRDTKDERFVKLTLTKKGVETIQTIESIFDDKYGKYLENKEENEFQAIFEGIKKLNSFIKDMSELSH